MPIMKALIFHNGSAQVEERPIPAPGPDEALLRTQLVGVCRTDIELLTGYYGFSGIPGHEFVATVEHAPAHPELTGKRVTADINCGCGECPRCLSNDPRHCATRTVLGIVNHDGAFAEFFTAPVRNLHLLDDSLPDDIAVFAEPLAAALEPSRQLNLAPPVRLLIMGDGNLGLLSALSLHLHNPDLLLLGKHQEKLDIARFKGIAVQHVSSTDNLPGLAKVLGPFDVVIEATGRPDGILHALDFVRPEGTIIAKTTCRKPAKLPMARIVVDEIQIIGSRCGDIGLALQTLNHLDPRPLIGATYPFLDAPKALRRARKRGAGKVLVKF
jgi:threonine dehydrogenase-like Zn-dependent dehydrogenase